MKHNKLPFDIQLERKYNSINIEEFINDWLFSKSERKERTLNIDNKLHIEVSKFATYEITISEVADLALRYALSKKDFKQMMTELINAKSIKLFFFENENLIL